MSELSQAQTGDEVATGNDGPFSETGMTPTSPEEPGSPKRPMAVGVSLAFGTILNVIPFFGGAIAVVAGVLALVQISRSAGGRPGKQGALIGIVLGLAGVVIWLVIAASTSLLVNQGVQGVAPPALPEVDDLQFELLTPPADARGPLLSLEAGQCFDTEPNPLTVIDFAEFTVVPCDGPHVAEFIGAQELAGAGGDYPGQDLINELSNAVCQDMVVAYTGMALADFEEHMALFNAPNQLDWEAGDEVAACTVVGLDLEPTTGSVASTG